MCNVKGSVRERDCCKSLLLFTGNCDILSKHASCIESKVLLHSQRKISGLVWRFMCLAASSIVSKQVWQRIVLKAKERKWNTICVNYGPCWIITLKGTFKSCVGWVCFPCLKPQWIVFFIYYCCSSLLGIDTENHSKSSWFWVDSLITWTRRTNKTMSCV